MVSGVLHPQSKLQTEGTKPKESRTGQPTATHQSQQSESKQKQSVLYETKNSSNKQQRSRVAMLCHLAVAARGPSSRSRRPPPAPAGTDTGCRSHVTSRDDRWHRMKVP